MKRKLYVFLACVLGVTGLMFAQNRPITGTVVSADDGQPVIGAYVIVAGSNEGTTTDVNGQFSINANPGTLLNFSYIGMESVTVAAQNGMRVVMKADTKNLEDVVVVGYGTMKRRDLTGSIVQLKASDITAAIANNPLEALQGKSTGVAVFSNSQPGSQPTLRIRGSASITAEVDPLIVVDGFPLVDGNMNDINPADIQSMEILKDASSTAIYGSRGANGVIMITTKKGSASMNNITAHANLGVATPSRLVKVVNTEDFINYITAAYANATGTTPLITDATANTDWQREIIKSSSLTQDYSVVLDGANDKTAYMLSGGYYNQDALLPGTGFEKFTIHNNLDHKFNKWLTIGSSMQVTTATQDIITDPVLNDIFRYGWPTEPVYNADNSYHIVTLGEFFNPIATMNATNNKTRSLRFLGNFYAQADITKHLSYKLNIGYDTKATDNYTFLTSQNAKSLATGSTTSSGSQTWTRRRNKLMDHILSYQNQWDVHRFTVTAVYSWQDYRYNMARLSGQFENDQLGAYSFAGSNHDALQAESDIYGNRLISGAGRTTYAYKDKYLLTATLRFDGSSRFGADRKWGTFPSVGLAWRATEEEFLKDIYALSDLKIRASYGITGNQEIGNYNSLPRLTTDKNGNYADGYNQLIGYYESIGNSELRWERTAQSDLGFDLTLVDRVFVNFDYYNRQTSDLLYTVPIPSTSGYPNVLSNVGAVSNQGIEFALSVDAVRTKDLRVNIGGNFTTNTNKITELYGDVDEILLNNGTTGLARMLRVGDPVNAVYARHSMGIIKDEATLNDYKTRVPATGATAKLGDEMYEDLPTVDDGSGNMVGNGSIGIEEYMLLGSIEPKYYYGLNLNVDYKKLSLKVYGQGAFDYASMAGAENSATSGTKWMVGYQDIGSYQLWAESNIRNVLGLPSQYAYERMWNATTNPDGDFPAAGAQNVWQSDRTNAHWYYFVLRNIQLSYDFSDVVKINGVKSLALNINLKNFVSIANHRGYNPENGDVSNPYAKTVLFGLAAKF